MLLTDTTGRICVAGDDVHGQLGTARGAARLIDALCGRRRARGCLHAIAITRFPRRVSPIRPSMLKQRRARRCLGWWPPRPRGGRSVPPAASRRHARCSKAMMTKCRPVVTLVEAARRSLVTPVHEGPRSQWAAMREARPGLPTRSIRARPSSICQSWRAGLADRVMQPNLKEYPRQGRALAMAERKVSGQVTRKRGFQ